MYLKNIRLFQFKNFPEAKRDFSPGVNCLVGPNGVGKTNTLDAIHYLCLTKSAFNPVDQHQITHDELGFLIKGQFVRADKPLEVTCGVEMGKKKQLSINGSPYPKMSEHIGLLPLVLISPGDDALIRDGAEERRKFFDSMLSQIDKGYFQFLLAYQQVLKNRNMLLKTFHDRGKTDLLLLEPFDRQLLHLSQEIYEKRRSFLATYVPKVIRHYQTISGQKEQADIHYKSNMQEDNFPAQFRKSLHKDVALKRTNMGTHKDDFRLLINGYPLKKFGSQGQQKSFLIGLKLAQFEVFKEEKGFKPLLLLDDIFDKLDDARIAHLMELVAKGDFGQLFITDARPERSEKIMKSLNIPANFIPLDK
ncbi:DNA replication/repair protein RecF [Pleomorphovibrio marinus]|uniref:DNA replication/repair protein RecF n=1 Tax=Pleomorphovibrio marinus TaxID=2164132 RepID=UPI000E0C8FCD|nr:DNA replication/repair protein RecF [Pleomorphovibrio marinus]